MSDRLAIGQTGLSTSPVCLGWVRDPETVLVAFDAGINFFFLTGDLHWPIYEGTRRGLAALMTRGGGVRDQIVVAVVSYVTQPEFIYAPFSELLEAMPRLKHIDMIVIGGAHGAEFPTRQRLYHDFVRKGEFGAQAVGASFHDRAAALAAVNQAQVDLAFIRYNPVHPGAQTDLFPGLKPSPTRIFNFKSMTGYTKPRELRDLGITPEHWQPKPTDYYKFALSTPAVDGILCAFRHPRQVGALRRALLSRPLDEQEQHYLINLAKLSTGKARIA